MCMVNTTIKQKWCSYDMLMEIEGWLLWLWNYPFLHVLICYTLIRCEVGIRELPKESALGRLRGSDNVVWTLFVSLWYFYVWYLHLSIDFLSSLVQFLNFDVHPDNSLSVLSIHTRFFPASTVSNIILLLSRNLMM